MSLRTSLVLVILVAVVSIAAAWVFRNPPGPPREPDPPFFYRIGSDDIRAISITAGDETVGWQLRPDRGNRWFFNDPADIPVSHQRWGGITTLLGGPRTQRVLRSEIDNPANYGLETPATIISVGLRDGSNVTLHIGNRTPDGAGHYSRVVGYPQLVLVDSSWGDVLRRLAVEPPYPAWYYTMDPAQATEILFFVDNDLVKAYGYDRDGQTGWYLCDLPVLDTPCTGTVPLDNDRVMEALELIAAHRITGVELLNATGQDHQAHGTTLNAPAIEIRLEERTSPGITTVTGLALTLGNLTPDGGQLYVTAMHEDTVALADADWGLRILDLFEDDSLILQPATSEPDGA